MSGFKNVEGNRFLYPYTCPFFEPSIEDANKCTYMNLGNDYWEDNPVVLQKPGCAIGRKICFIAVDLYDKDHVRSAEELISALPSFISVSEAETIKLNIKDFYNMFCNGGDENERNVRRIPADS